MSKTLANLRAGVRILVKEDVAKRFTNTKVDYALNTVADMVWNKLGLLPHCEWLTARATAIPVVADTDAYDLPAGYTNFKTVEIWNGSAYAPLRPLDPDRSLRVEDGAGTTASLPSHYQLLGSQYVLRPTPSTAITNGVRFTGVSEYTDMSAVGDTTGMPKVLDAAIEAGAAAMLLVVEGSELAAGLQALHESWVSKAINILSRRHEQSSTMTYVGPEEYVEG